MSKVHICFEGLNVARIINELNKCGYTLFAVKRIDSRNACITIAAKEHKKVVAHLQEKCYNVRTIRYTGILWAIVKMRELAVVAVFLLLLCIAVTVCSRRLLIVETTGDKELVKQALEQYGIGFGHDLTAIDIDMLENHLCNSLDCAYSIVTISGCRLFVEVIQATTPQPIIDYTKKYDIVSQAEGVVRRVITLSGTQRVNVGDRVTVGQILIEGVRTYVDGSTSPVRAVGEVYIEVSTSATSQYQPLRTVYTRTGEYTDLVHITIAKVQVPSNRAIEFELYESQNDEYLLFPLAIKIVKERVYCLRAEVVSVTFAQDEQRMYQEALQKAMSAAEFGVIRTEKNVNGNSITVTVYGIWLQTDKGVYIE